MDMKLRPHRATILVIFGVNVVVGILYFTGGPEIQQQMKRGALFPEEITTGTDRVGSYTEINSGKEIVFPEAPLSPYATLLTYSWLHAGPRHLVSNMLLLIVFGPVVCRQLGTYRFAILYLVCSIVAGLTHALYDPLSAVGLVGSSGPIMGIVGAYLVFKPHYGALAAVGLFSISLIELSTTDSSVILAYLSAPSHQVSHPAHLGGAFIGAILFYSIRRWCPQQKRRI